eukprot:jgi/Picre1/28166/NNA_003572.t1
MLDLVGATNTTTHAAAADGSLTGVTPDGSILRVREVWEDNLDDEMKLIREIVDDYPFLAMDTEFRLGLTFSDAHGNLPRINNELCVWQFNFREFCLAEDMYAGDSIELLKQSGIDFAQNEARGIDVRRFGSSLPQEADFFELLKLFFPTLYDIKYLMKFCNGMHGGLNKLAETLNVERIGPQHQAGSDSLVTCATFLKLADTSFNGLGSMDAHLGVLYGLGSDGHRIIQDIP